MPLTVEELYKSYVDPSQDFSEDIFDWFMDPENITHGSRDHLSQVFGSEYEWTGPEYSEEQFIKERWAQEWGPYIPMYDSTGEKQAFEDKLLSLRDAGNVYNLSRDISDRVYDTSTRTARQKLDEEIKKGKHVAGDIGLRSGSLAGALEESTEKYSNQVTDLADTLGIARDKDLNTYNKKVSEAALDYEKTAYEEKRDFYDDVMRMTTKLAELGAFDVDVYDEWLDWGDPERGYEAWLEAEMGGREESCALQGSTWNTETNSCEGMSADEFDEQICIDEGGLWNTDLNPGGCYKDPLMTSTIQTDEATCNSLQGIWDSVTGECSDVTEENMNLLEVSEEDQFNTCTEGGGTWNADTFTCEGGTVVEGDDDVLPSAESCAAMPCICNDYGQQICYEYNWHSGECQGKATNDNSGCQ